MPSAGIRNPHNIRSTALARSRRRLSRGRPMKQHSTVKISAMILLTLVLLPGSAAAQAIKDQIVGAWTFVSALDVHPDGRKDDRWGANPKGVFIFDKSGRYAQFISRSDLPKIAGGRSDKG